MLRESAETLALFDTTRKQALFHNDIVDLGRLLHSIREMVPKGFKYIFTVEVLQHLTKPRQRQRLDLQKELLVLDGLIILQHKLNENLLGSIKLRVHQQEDKENLTQVTEVPLTNQEADTEGYFQLHSLVEEVPDLQVELSIPQHSFGERYGDYTGEGLRYYIQKLIGLHSYNHQDYSLNAYRECAYQKEGDLLKNAPTQAAELVAEILAAKGGKFSKALVKIVASRRKVRTIAILSRGSNPREGTIVQ